MIKLLPNSKSALNSARIAINKQTEEKQRLTQHGLYHPKFESDACGVGLIAAIDGKPSRKVVTAGLEALAALWHRGAVDADGKTGDGAGLHMAIPKEFFKKIIRSFGFELPDYPPNNGDKGSAKNLNKNWYKDIFALGMIFLPRTNFATQERTREIIESEIISSGFRLYGWRQVPTDISVLGAKAQHTRPEIEQLLIENSKNLDAEQFERALYIMRRKIEKQFLKENLLESYICSLSCYSVIYKGLCLAEHLGKFFPDFQEPEFISNFALYHQRYSTNTFPAWSLAQPFRIIAHNGEINTLSANLNWMKNRERRMEDKAFPNIDDILPVVQAGTSDSGALDNVFELYLRSNRSLPEVKSLLMPEAWEQIDTMPKNQRDFYHYAHGIMEPWDGPAAICAVSHPWALAGSDRNGLRPLRYVITNDNLLIVGSENGMVKTREENLLARGRVGPGEMIAVNLETGRFYQDTELKNLVANRYPYHQWVNKVHRLEDVLQLNKNAKLPAMPLLEPAELIFRQTLSGWSLEDLELILNPMVETAKEATGSMGDDSPIAVLCQHYRGFHHFFRQHFAQVTNPPIDSLRERHVMSLKTRLNNLGNSLTPDEKQLDFMELPSPILLEREFQALKNWMGQGAVTIKCYFQLSADNYGLDLKHALDDIKTAAINAASAGKSYIILDNTGTDPSVQTAIPIPMILAVGAVHTALSERGLRSFTSINVYCDEPLDTHHFAVLVGVGATTITPVLALETIRHRVQNSIIKLQPTNTANHTDTHNQTNSLPSNIDQALKNYQKAVNDGLLKIMSKMGIAVISSYRGGYVFEALGLARALTTEFFPGILSRISGLGLEGLAHLLAEHFHQAKSNQGEFLPVGGFYRYRPNNKSYGEPHAWNGLAIHQLQHAVSRDSFGLFKAFSKTIATLPPIHVRDLLTLKLADKSIPLEEVESIADIRKRLVAPGISLGALSPIAHATLSIAMNRIGAKSNSGEGGEDASRYKPYNNGDNACSAIKQIASGRFGVTAEYLNNCEEIEIKMAQGAKPGEGGQLPGYKVSDIIARLRHSTKGVTLISPPPHHDIYSIEDLAQLIYDLKQINPTARVCVKLVARAGVGTIAAGVVKAKADAILISGHSGGTGASPQSSIKYAGLPWEIGLAETHQVLCLNGLRDRVTLRTDGGIKTGKDVIIAAILGAEEFGVGTASLIAMGCLMVRQCHSNTCPVGICTQDEKLIEQFKGSPEKVVSLFSLLAEEIRELLSQLGYRHIHEIIGKTELLQQVVAKTNEYKFLDALDLNPLLVKPDSNVNFAKKSRNIINPVPVSLDQQILKDAEKLFAAREKMQLEYSVVNTMRSIGARVASAVIRQFQNNLPPAHLTVQLRGTAGQSFGAFLVKGIKFILIGVGNDYVGKGLSGGEIFIRPPYASKLASHQHTIIGNTCLYGATSGKLYAAGQAGERFAVRNSGAVAVVEGVGSNGCEYMTGGEVMVLGHVGRNFAAGMTGGIAYLYHADDAQYVNQDTVGIYPLSAEWQNHAQLLLTDYVKETGSPYGQALLQNWHNTAKQFRMVVPNELVKLQALIYPVAESIPAQTQPKAQLSANKIMHKIADKTTNRNQQPVI